MRGLKQNSFGTLHRQPVQSNGLAADPGRLLRLCLQEFQRLLLPCQHLLLRLAHIFQRFQHFLLNVYGYSPFLISCHGYRQMPRAATRGFRPNDDLHVTIELS